jgi:hypothetical protein
VLIGACLKGANLVGAKAINDQPCDLHRQL